MHFMLKHFLMDAVSGGAEGGDGGAGGGAAATVPTPAPDAAAAPPPATALSAGQPPAENPYEFVSEKYRVNKEDGSFDVDASFKKVAEAHSHLEKRFGSGDVPPKSADEYKVAVPDQFKEAWQADDPQFKDFAAKAHELGLNQAQFGFFMDKFFEIVPAVAGEASALTVESCDAELGKIYQTPQAIDAAKDAARGAIEALARGYGMNAADIDAQLGNSPIFIQLMAKLAPEFREDGNVQGGMMNSQEDVGALMRSQAYKDDKHPDHGKVQAKIRAHYERKFGSQQVY